jgi:hypothetical protein
MKQHRLFYILLFLWLVSFKASSQFSLIGGFNFYNQHIEIGEYGFTQSRNALNMFYLAPQLGVKYQFNSKHSVRYLKSYQIIFPRNFFLEPPITIFDIRNLDRLNYAFHFKKGSYITSGFTYHLYKSEGYFSLGGFEAYSGNFGLNIGYGKEFNHGFIELSNLFALEFGEMTPASLFGFWVIDFGYYLKVGKKKTVTDGRMENKKERTVFGIGLVSSLSFFDNRSLIPTSTLFRIHWGTDVHYHIKNWHTDLFWRRTTTLFTAPASIATPSVAAVAQWNNIGFRPVFTTNKGFKFYATSSFLFGFDPTQTFPAYVTQDNKDLTISGFTIGTGIPLNNWAFELSADCYLDVPVPQIQKGFGWDRIKASVIYNLPIITK